MIYTLTLNPAIDYIIGTDNLKEGEVNRTSFEKILPGGKGINVSIVLKNLGVDNTALGITAGFTGAEIENMLKSTGVKTDFVYSENGFSRINVKIKAEKETEINGRGPEISDTDIKNLYKKLDNLNDEDVLVIAGSVPKSMPETIYCDILEYLKGKKINIIIDTTGKALHDALKFKPFLIKPNDFELGELFGTVLKTEEEIILCCKQLQKKGARNIIVSLGAKGALMMTENGEILRCEAHKGKVINTTGSGDSLVAGFIAGYLKKHDLKYALELGVASGSASAFSENLATGEEIRRIFKEVKRRE